MAAWRAAHETTKKHLGRPPLGALHCCTREAFGSSRAHAQFKARCLSRRPHGAQWGFLANMGPCHSFGGVGRRRQAAGAADYGCVAWSVAPAPAPLSVGGLEGRLHIELHRLASASSVLSTRVAGWQLVCRCHVPRAGLAPSLALKSLCNAFINQSNGGYAAPLRLRVRLWRLPHAFARRGLCVLAAFPVAASSALPAAAAWPLCFFGPGMLPAAPPLGWCISCLSPSACLLCPALRAIGRRSRRAVCLVAEWQLVHMVYGLVPGFALGASLLCGQSCR